MDYDITLITEVRKHPELYDNTQINFKHKELKHEIWKQIAFELRNECDDESVRLVKMRWKSLRDSFVKENKHRNAFSNGEDVKPKRNWRFSEAMEFLTPFLAPSNPAKGIRRNAYGQSTHGLEGLEPVENYYVTPEDLKEMSEDGSNGPTTSEWTTFPQESEIAILQDNAQDEIDSFFKGIADTVKKLSTVNQVKIQRDIVNMVLDVKLKEAEGDKDPLDAP